MNKLISHESLPFFMAGLDGIVGSYFANAFPSAGITSGDIEPVSVVIKQAHYGFYRSLTSISKPPDPFGLHLRVRSSEESGVYVDPYVLYTSPADIKGLMEQLGCTRTEDFIGKTLTAYVLANPPGVRFVVALGIQK